MTNDKWDLERMMWKPQGQMKDRWRTWGRGTFAAALDTCGSWVLQVKLEDSQCVYWLEMYSTGSTTSKYISPPRLPPGSNHILDKRGHSCMDIMTGEDTEVLSIVPVTQHLCVCEYKNTLLVMLRTCPDTSFIFFVSM